MKTKVILTGATGMVGEGVLLECLAHPNVGKVLVVGRHPCGMTINFAETFIEQNPDAKLTFIYVSGYATDSSGQGKTMWARVKGKTENSLIKMFPGGAYMFRPGYMRPTKGQKNVSIFYFGWHVSYPFMKFFMPKFTCTLAEVGSAMINCSLHGFSKNILEAKDIIDCSK
jgi:hypothetical protein